MRPVRHLRGCRRGITGKVYGHNVGGVTFFGRDLSYVDAAAGTLLVRNLFGFVRRGLDDVADGIGAAVKDPIGTIDGFFP